MQNVLLYTNWGGNYFLEITVSSFVCMYNVTGDQKYIKV